MRALLKTSVAISLAVVLTGCPRYTKPVLPQPRMTAAERNFESLWEAAREVLRKYRFELDYQDRRSGVIRTVAMTGEHFGEFWRRDAATNRDLAESTVQTVYRQARVTIVPSAAAGYYRPEVEVFTFRSNREVPHVTSTSEALDLFRSAKAKGSGKKASADYGGDKSTGTLTPLGRDEQLEATITAEILVASRILN